MCLPLQGDGADSPTRGSFAPLVRATEAARPNHFLKNWGKLVYVFEKRSFYF
jgi:hypothetical protein